MNINFISVINVDGKNLFNKCFTYFCDKPQLHPLALASYFKFVLQIYPKISSQKNSRIHKVNFGNTPLYCRLTKNQKQIIVLGVTNQGKLQPDDKKEIIKNFNLFESIVNKFIRRKIEKQAFKQIIEKFSESNGLASIPQLP